ncbi:MAG: ABC transporter substrate-binding protein [Janthinobacterium lividum]
MRRRLATLFAAAIAFMPVLSQPAAAQIKIGVIVSTTGSAASLGTPQRNSIDMLPKSVGSQGVEYIVLDDGSDSERAVTEARKLIDESRVDAIIGSSTTAASLALVNVASSKNVPLVALGSSAKIVLPMDAQRQWVFKTSQSDSLMADAIALHMFRAGVRTVGFIGFTDAYGEGWLTEAKRALEAMTIKLVATERYVRTDPDVSKQASKLLAAKPDAVLIAGSGVPTAWPQKALHTLGYTGKYYQTHGAAVMEFLKVGGPDVEGTILPVGPVLVASQLPDSNPVKVTAEAYVQKYEAAYGSGSVAAYGAFAYDAATVLNSAIPVALLTAKPGTPEFRTALRDALETVYELAMSNGVAEMTAKDHNGYDNRARVMVTVQDGAWKLLP